MAVLTLGSNNPYFSHILSKNPHTIRDSGKAFRREVRKGVVYGWYTNQVNSEFRLWFKDAEAESSFATGISEEFEYLDRSRYGSPYIPISMIQHALSSASKKQEELDTSKVVVKSATPGVEDTEICCEAYAETIIKVPSRRFLEQMSIHYEQDAAITFEEVKTPYYRIRVAAATVFEVLNILQTVCLIQCLVDTETYIRMDKDSVGRYIRCLNSGNAPYYPRYLFQMKAINNRDMFSKLKGELEGEGMSLCFGNTRQQRYDAIRPHLDGKAERLVDIGCGEMFYSLKMMNAYSSVFAIDGDEEIAENNQGKIKGRNIENVTAIHQVVDPEWVVTNDHLFSGSDVLLTEVLEHMPMKDSDSLLSEILHTDFNKVVVTCPNKSFNKYYALAEDQTRHDEHHFEPTLEEFSDWMVTLAAEADVDVSVSGIGDCVNDTSTSLMAVFTKKETK